MVGNDLECDIRKETTVTEIGQSLDIRRDVRVPFDVEFCGWIQSLDTDPVFCRVDIECVRIHRKIVRDRPRNRRERAHVGGSVNIEEVRGCFRTETHATCLGIHVECIRINRQIGRDIHVTHDMKIGIGRLGLNSNGVCGRIDVERVFINCKVTRRVHVTNHMEVRVRSLGLDSDTMCRRIHMECIIINGQVPRNIDITHNM